MSAHLVAILGDGGQPGKVHVVAGEVMATLVEVLEFPGGGSFLV